MSKSHSVQRGALSRTGTSEKTGIPHLPLNLHPRNSEPQIFQEKLVADIEEDDTRHLWPRLSWDEGRGGGEGEGTIWALDRCLHLTEAPPTPCSFSFQI